jgi:purine-binding chemotaxis protein CheW
MTEKRKKRNDSGNLKFMTNDTEKSDKPKAQTVIKEVAAKQDKQEKLIVEMKQLVTFSLDKEEYAAIITDLREIIRIPEIVSIPGAPNFIRGILNLRGQLVVVIDLERRVGLVRENNIDPKHIIIVEIGETIFGIIVDEVSGVLRVPVSSIRPAPGLVSAKISTDFLKGVVILEKKEGELGGQESNKAPTVGGISPVGSTKKPASVSSDEVTSSKRKDKKSTKKENVEEIDTDKDEIEISENQQLGDSSRLVLLLDLPKLLAEKDLLEFGKAVLETASEV